MKGFIIYKYIVEINILDKFKKEKAEKGEWIQKFVDIISIDIFSVCLFGSFN